MRASQYLCQEHRRIEQALVLLVNDPGVDLETLARFRVELADHVDMKERLYRLVERLGPCALAPQREVGRRIKVLSAQAAARGIRTIRRKAILQTLERAFQEYARRDERTLHPGLEAVLGADSLKELALYASPVKHGATRPANRRLTY